MLMIPDVVRLKRTTPEVPLPVGTEGTVLNVHDSKPRAYDVEFMDGAESLGVFATLEDDLELIWREGHWYIPEPKPPGKI